MKAKCKRVVIRHCACRLRSRLVRPDDDAVVICTISASPPLSAAACNIASQTPLSIQPQVLRRSARLLAVAAKRSCSFSASGSALSLSIRRCSFFLSAPMPAPASPGLRNGTHAENAAVWVSRATERERTRLPLVWLRMLGQSGWVHEAFFMGEAKCPWVI
jgi:hypothetical protein